LYHLKSKSSKDIFLPSSGEDTHSFPDKKPFVFFTLKHLSKSHKKIYPSSTNHNIPS